MSMTLRGVTKQFGEFAAVDDVNLDILSGALLALLGPSGCGKTTLLRIIAGLETPESGQVLFDGRDATLWPIRDRKVGFVFQSYALFRHMSVFENIAFGLKVKARRERPSGVAIRRKVQLLDEPFGALDAQVRHELRRWLRRLHTELHFTSIFVTHDQQEAIEVADTIVVLNRGRIEQTGIPGEVYDLPRSAYVHRFLGQVNELRVHLRDGRAYLGPIDISPAADVRTGDANNIALIRPHEIEIGPEGVGWPATVVAGRVIGPIGPLEVRPQVLPPK